MQAVTAELRRLRRKIPLLFGGESFENCLFRSLYLKTGSYTDAKRLYKSFLARNELVASISA